MKYNWNVGWDPIPQIGTSVAASVMAVISYFRVFGVKRFKKNMAPTCSLISFPLLFS